MSDVPFILMQGRSKLVHADLQRLSAEKVKEDTLPLYRGVCSGHSQRAGVIQRAVEL
jgi:hypothetical protein